MNPALDSRVALVPGSDSVEDRDHESSGLVSSTGLASERPFRSPSLPQVLRRLVNLTEPASTITLARRMRLTPGAINQHLSVLHNSRLVSRTRVTGSVLYCRTRRGDGLTE